MIPKLDLNSLIYIPYPRVNCLKTIPFKAAHTYIANIWQYPPPASPRKNSGTECLLKKWQRPFRKGKFAPLMVTGNWPPYPTCSYWGEIMIQTDYISFQFNIYHCEGFENADKLSCLGLSYTETSCRLLNLHVYQPGVGRQF